MLTIRQLEVFERIAQSGSLTQAATSLNIAQPALSRMVRQIEADLGTTLLYRTGRGVSLTQAGYRFLDHGVEILKQLRQMRLELEELGSTLQGTATVAMPTGVGRVVMVPLVTQFKELFPLARIRVIELFTGDIAAQLASGQVDVAAVYSHSGASGINHDPIVVEDLHLVGMADSPAVQAPDIPLEEAVQHPLILPTRSEGVRGLFDRKTATANLEPNIYLEVDATVSLLDLVRKRLGYALFPYCVVHQEVENGELRAARVVEPCLRRTLMVATSTSRPLSPTAREAARLLRSSILELAPLGRWQKCDEQNKDMADAS